MRKKDTLYICIIIILLIISIVLLFNTKFNKVETNNEYPTGNIDVFDINIKCEDINENIDSSKNKNTDKNTINNKNVISKRKCVYTDSNGIKKTIYSGNDQKSENIIEKETPIDSGDNQESENIIEKEKTLEELIYVDDKSGNYVYQNNLNIFSNPAFNYKNKIAPGSHNTYNFQVHNSSNMTLNYNIDFSVESEYDINLKYRIRKNNEYIAGDENNYVSIDDISIPLTLLNSDSTDNYSIDWKWFDDDENDNIIGENMKEEYKLMIHIYFDQVEL